MTVKTGQHASEELVKALKNHVTKEIGAIAWPDDIRFTSALPKTRSGKIMRRLLKEICAGGTIKGDVTTLEDFSVAPGEFFDPELRVWYQDTDLLHRLRLAGRAPVYVPESVIRHGLSETVRSRDPELATWIREQVHGDRVTFEAKHGRDIAGMPHLVG